MQAVREAAGGLIYAAISVVLVLGSLSLVLAEGAPRPSPSAAATVAATASATTVPSASPVPSTPVRTLGTTVTPSPSALPTILSPSATEPLLFVTTYAPRAARTAINRCGPYAGWVKAYRVQAGDTLFQIATRYGITLETLRRANCRYRVTIYVGELLWVPYVPIFTGGFTGGQASSTVTVTCTAGGAPYTYTGSPQTPCAAEATGVGMSPVDVTSSLIYLNNTNVGVATATAGWAGDTNHTGNTGTGGFMIGQASSTVTVTCTAGAPYTYTGSPQTPCTAQATGAGMSPLDVSASLTYADNTNAGVATATASWAGDTNHTGNVGSGSFAIGPASSTVTVTCPLTTQTFTGSAIEPCTAQATGAGMSPVDVSASLTYAHNTKVGTATADASWAGDTNHTGNTGSGSFTIG